MRVRLTGLEPALREKLDPKSSASTNSATGALQINKKSGAKGASLFSVSTLGFGPRTPTMSR